VSSWQWANLFGGEHRKQRKRTRSGHIYEMRFEGLTLYVGSQCSMIHYTLQLRHSSVHISHAQVSEVGQPPWALVPGPTLSLRKLCGLPNFGCFLVAALTHKINTRSQNIRQLPTTLPLLLFLIFKTAFFYHSLTLTIAQVVCTVSPFMAITEVDLV